MPSEEKIPTQLTDRTICIIGPRRLQNQLLANFLHQESGVTCLEGEDVETVFAADSQKDHDTKLLLWDCHDMDIDTMLLELKPHSDQIFGRHFLVPFNVDPDLGNEEKALDCGIRGFFYRQDSPEQLLKGIRAIFSNELWVSREILTKCILENRGKEENSKIELNVLTARETEILALISAGTKNEEIADKLCISPHTVRTHIYNIFKKINVPNRLQAALWAVQNL